MGDSRGPKTALLDIDARESGVSAGELDKMVLVESIKVSQGLDSIKKHGAPIYFIVVFLIGLGGYAFSFAQEWRVVRDAGSPAMLKMREDLRVEIAGLKKIEDDRYDQLTKILSNQNVTNALLSQRLDQHEKELERLRGSRNER